MICLKDLAVKSNGKAAFGYSELEKHKGSIPGWNFPLEEEMATCSSLLAWEIPWTEKPGGL